MCVLSGNPQSLLFENVQMLTVKVFLFNLTQFNLQLLAVN